MMELKEIENVGDATLEKLNEYDYNTIEDLDGVTFDELIRMGVTEKAANSIIGVINEDENPEDDGIEESSEFDLEKQNRYLVAGFKVSKHYDNELKGEKLKEAFEIFKGE